MNRAKFNKKVGDTYSFQLEREGTTTQSIAVVGDEVASTSGSSGSTSMTIHQVFKRISEATRDATVVGLDVLYIMEIEACLRRQSMEGTWGRDIIAFTLMGYFPIKSASFIGTIMTC